ncbi:hypothetical protein FLGE108171_15340 [Flavobacterium gelidilacus]|nr:hypothetical protein [Flavobacterium gelidilacus]
MSNDKNGQNPKSQPSGKANNVPGNGEITIKGSVPNMKNPPPPPKSKD